MRRLVLAFLCAMAAWAQTTTVNGPGGTSGPNVVETNQSNAYSTGTQDFTNAAAFLPQHGSTLPGTCAVGQFYSKDNATAGANVYSCTAANTWTAQGLAGSPAWSSLQNPSAGLSLAMGSYANTFNFTNSTQVLNLVQSPAGLNYTFTEPNYGANPNDRSGLGFTCNTDAWQSNPNFSDENCLEISQNVYNGQSDFDGAAKKFFASELIYSSYYGAGQHNNLTNTLYDYGDGDAFPLQNYNFFWGGVASNGDEGQYVERNTLQQAGQAVTATISTVTTSTCNTTLTQAVTPNATVQAVTVASTTNCTVGSWQTIDGGNFAGGSTSANNEEAVLITAVNSGVSITAQFRHLHSSGATVKGASVLVLNSTAQFGALRLLVDTTAASYSTGTAAAASTRVVTGTGTAWSNTMLTGGNALMPGCIAFAADTQAAAGHGNVKAWYGIAGVSSGTSLTIAHQSVIGLASYTGLATTAGAYQISQCARILDFAATPTGTQNTVVLEANGFTWTVGDTVENAISTDADITGDYFGAAVYVPGETMRSLFDVRNVGAQAFAAGLEVDQNLAGGYTLGYQFGVDVSATTNYGLSVSGNTTNHGVIISNSSYGTSDLYWSQGPWSVGPASGNTLFTVGAISGNPYLSLDSSAGYGHIYGNGLYLDSLGGGTGGKLVFNDTNSGAGRIWTAQTVQSGYAGDGALQWTPTETAKPVFEFSGGQGAWQGFYSVPQNTATSSNNYASTALGAITSVWNGSAAANIQWMQRVVPATGTNPMTQWSVYSPSASGGSLSNPKLNLAVTQTGKLFAGANDQQNGTDTGVWIDPTGTTAERTLTVPDASGTISLAIKGSLTTTTATSDAATVTGATASSHCNFSATNASGAANIATTYISTKAANTITLTHATTAGMTYDIVCTLN